MGRIEVSSLQILPQQVQLSFDQLNQQFCTYNWSELLLITLTRLEKPFWLHQLHFVHRLKGVRKKICYEFIFITKNAYSNSNQGLYQMARLNYEYEKIKRR